MLAAIGRSPHRSLGVIRGDAIAPAIDPDLHGSIIFVDVQSRLNRICPYRSVMRRNGRSGHCTPGISRRTEPWRENRTKGNFGVSGENLVSGRVLADYTPAVFAARIQLASIQRAPDTANAACSPGICAGQIRTSSTNLHIHPGCRRSPVGSTGRCGQVPAPGIKSRRVTGRCYI